MRSLGTRNARECDAGDQKQNADPRGRAAQGSLERDVRLEEVQAEAQNELVGILTDDQAQTVADAMFRRGRR